MPGGSTRSATARRRRAATRQFREGYAKNESLAQRNLFAVEQRVLQLRAELLATEVGLYRALGGGWSPEDEAANG